MFLGIEKLEPYNSLEMSGLFVMTVPSFLFAKSILVQTVIQNPSTKTALISFEKRNELFDVSSEIRQKLADIYDKEHLSLNSVYLNGDERRLFSNIKQDMEKKIFSEIELILIEFDQESFSFMLDEMLSVLLSGWQSWLRQKKKTCVWLIHGDMAASLVRNKFLALNNLFNGLANIEFDVSEIKYELIFWHLYSSIKSNVLLNLSFDQPKLLLSFAESNELALTNTVTLSLSKNNRVLVVKPHDDGSEVFPREWEVLPTLDNLEPDMISNTAATVIIYIDSSINVNAMAARILEIRKNGGVQLKIILRETEQCLRNIEEKFILNAGANLVVPYSTIFLRFITIVYAVQGSYFIRNVPNTIDEIYQIDLDNYGKSYIPQAEFVRQVAALVNSAQQMQINSSLVKLTLNKAIPIAEVSALLRIKRSGDIFTFTQNYLYLFLFQCEQSEIRKALSHLIALPIEDLFLEQDFFSYIDGIRSEIRDINLETQDEQDAILHAQSAVNESITRDKKVVRKAAIPSPLILKKSQP